MVLLDRVGSLTPHQGVSGGGDAPLLASRPSGRDIFRGLSPGELHLSILPCNLKVLYPHTQSDCDNSTMRGRHLSLSNQKQLPHRRYGFKMPIARQCTSCPLPFLLSSPTQRKHSTSSECALSSRGGVARFVCHSLTNPLSFSHSLRPSCSPTHPQIICTLPVPSPAVALQLYLLRVSLILVSLPQFFGCVSSSLSLFVCATHPSRPISNACLLCRCSSPVNAPQPRLSCLA